MTDVAEVFVVINPVAGNSEPEAIKAALERHLGDAGLAYQPYETTGEESLLEAVRAALERGFDLFVAEGGDGTVSGVVGGLVDSGKPLGIIPVGTGNGLARDLDIPLDLDGALRLVVGEHALRRVDVLDVDGFFAVLNVSVGLGAEMMSDTERASKRRPCPLGPQEVRSHKVPHLGTCDPPGPSAMSKRSAVLPRAADETPLGLLHQSPIHQALKVLAQHVLLPAAQ